MSSSGQKIFQCHICYQKFSRRFNLDVHVKLRHLNEKNFPCDLCDQICGRKPDLKKHKLKYHTRWIEGEYPPPGLGISPSPRASPSPSPNLLPEDHSSPIKSNKRSPEPDITVTDDANPSPSKKFRGLSPEKDPNCPILPMGSNCPILSKEASPILPMLKKEPKKSYTCDFCNIIFTTPSNLKIHKTNVHERQKNYICETCDKAFDRKFNLQVHVKMKHNQSREFKCELCPHACSRKPDLKKHIKTYHNCDETESEILIDSGFL